MINKILKDNWSELGWGMWRYDEERFPANEETDNPYLFPKHELGKTYPSWERAKKNGEVRHCKILRNGKFFDYVVRQEYDTLEEWMASANIKLEDVCYGTNRYQQYRRNWLNNGRLEYVPQKPRYVPLLEVLKKYGYVEPPKVEIPDYTGTKNLTELVDLEMKMRGLSIENVFIAKGGNISRWTEFMNVD